MIPCISVENLTNTCVLYLAHFFSNLLQTFTFSCPLSQNLSIKKYKIKSKWTSHFTQTPSPMSRFVSKLKTPHLSCGRYLILWMSPYDSILKFSLEVFCRFVEGRCSLPRARPKAGDGRTVSQTVLWYGQPNRFVVYIYIFF